MHMNFAQTQFNYSKTLELFEFLRSHPTLVVHRSRYSCAVCTQNHVSVREKSNSVSRFQRFVGRSGNEIDGGDKLKK
jgi:hypothetical protein